MTWVLALALHAGPCAGCHLDVHEAFAKTRHARAHDEPLFQRSWQRVGRRPWCTSCHDPLGGGRGLTCELCHAEVAEKLEGHERRPMQPTSADVCAHCHQFAAPEPHFETVAMQDTVNEWRRARAGGETRSCVDCHFDGISHGTNGGHGPPAIEVSSNSPGCLTLRAPGVGHAVPTGDPFHRLRLSFCEDEACSRVVATRWLRRDIAMTDAGVAAVVLDTRVPAGVLGERRECVAPASARRAKFWKLEVLHAEPELTDVPAEERRRTVSSGRMK